MKSATGGILNADFCRLISRFKLPRPVPGPDLVAVFTLSMNGNVLFSTQPPGYMRLKYPENSGNADISGETGLMRSAGWIST